MPIDITQEKLITFSELARSLPCRRGNRPIHIATIHRWRSRGLDGIRLEGIKIGGAWHTSREAFRRFTDHLTARANATDPVSHPVAHTPPSESADKALQSSGW